MFNLNRLDHRRILFIVAVLAVVFLLTSDRGHCAVHENDAKVVDNIIEHNDLKYPQSTAQGFSSDQWDFATLTGGKEQRIVQLDLANKGLTGDLDLSGMPYLASVLCDDNQLTSIDLKSDKRLENLICSDNQVNQIKDLPDSLETLICNSNQINRLDPLPENLNTLICSDNPLNTLAKLPKSMKRFYADNTGVLYVNSMPKNIQEISYSNNSAPLINLSGLKGLKVFYAGNNPVSEFTGLDGSKLNINFSNSGYTMLDKKDATIDETVGYDLKNHKTYIRAVANPGYKFDHWEIEPEIKLLDDTSTETEYLSFSLDEDISITPVFKEVPQKLDLTLFWVVMGIVAAIALINLVIFAYKRKTS